MTFIAFQIESLHSEPKPTGLSRLAGSYSGPMEFHDDTDGRDKSFDVDLVVSLGSGLSSTSFKWTFNFAPPQKSVSLENVTISESGRMWKETGNGETLTFKLTNWIKFSQRKSNWFEIVRQVKKSGTGQGYRFRRRYSISRQTLISEKWLKYPGKAEYRSHKMVLKRI